MIEHIKLNDHHALGIIDSFAKILKRILSKEFLENKNTKWINILPNIIENYNNTPNSSLDNITPNDAISNPNKRIHVLHLNILKGKQNGFITDLHPGDKVRLDETALFKKGTENRWSDNVHIVESASGKTVHLTDGQTLKRDKVLLVPHNTITATEKNVIKVATKKQKDKELFQVVLDKTPFYAESGGQVGDTGYLDFAGEKVDVLDTKKENDLIVHFVKKLPTKVDVAAHAKINTVKRSDTIKNHSATHLLQSALRIVLGNHVQQKGSLVNADYLRFDFAHFSKMTDQEIAKVEQIVNEKIMENIALDERRNVPIADAEKLGATMLFGEKYGEFVRVITFDEKFSRELCGGTHVKSTGQIGLFKIISESSIASGVRRIEAVTGKKAIELANSAITELTNVKAALNNSKDVLKSIDALKNENEELKRKIENYVVNDINREIKEYKEKFEVVGNVKLWAIIGVDLPDADSMRTFGNLLSKSVGSNHVILISQKYGNRIIVHLRIAPSLNINGNQLLKELSPSIKGGGPADFVQASAGSVNEVEDLIVKLKTKFA